MVVTFFCVMNLSIVSELGCGEVNLELGVMRIGFKSGSALTHCMTDLEMVSYLVWVSFSYNHSLLCSHVK